MEIINKFPGWLDRLEKSASLSRNQLQRVPDQGIYVFYDEKDQPLYVGRSDHLRARLLAHSRPSSGHESATFAFMLAKENLGTPGSRIPRSRREIQMDEKFSKKYLEKKEEVAKMNVRIIEIIDPAEQALFEIYAALELDTPYNVWENR